MAKNERKYTKYKGPQSSPMWRDPAHTKKSGCPLSVLILVALVAAPVWGVVALLG